MGFFNDAPFQFYFLFVIPSTHLPIYLSTHPFIYLSIHLSIHPLIYLSLYLSIYLGQRYCQFPFPLMLVRFLILSFFEFYQTILPLLLFLSSLSLSIYLFLSLSPYLSSPHSLYFNVLIHTLYLHLSDSAYIHVFYSLFLCKLLFVRDPSPQDICPTYSL